MRVLGYAAGVAALTCIFFGLTPALRATRISPSAAMKVAGRGLTAGRERFSLRRGLVVFQVALSLVLVASALLFSRSLNKLVNLDAGFNQENLLISRVGFNRLKVEPERRLGFRKELLEKIKSVPGVEDVAEMDTLPLTGGGRGNNVWLQGRTTDTVGCSFNTVGLDYFKTLQIPLVAGRTFNNGDSSNAPTVAIINQTLAQMLHEANPIGQRLWVEATPGDPETQFDIVGIARDAKFEDLREDPIPVVYLASTQEPYPTTTRQYLIRSHLPT